MNTKRSFKLDKKSSHKKNLSKKLVVCAIVGLIAVLAGGTWLIYAQRNQPAEESENSQSSQENENDSGSENGGSFKENAEAPRPHDDSDITLPPQNKASIQMRSFGQNNGMVSVTVDTLLVGGTGRCVFTFTNPEDRPVVREVNGDGQTCSLSVPSVEFARLGIWGLNIAYFREQAKVAETNQNVTIN